MQAITSVAAGQSVLDPSITKRVMGRVKSSNETTTGRQKFETLSNQERRILAHVAEGKTNKEIATVLNLSVYTIDAHRGRIMEKLNLHSTGELVRFAVRNGLID